MAEVGYSGMPPLKKLRARDVRPVGFVDLPERIEEDKKRFEGLCCRLTDRQIFENLAGPAMNAIRERPLSVGLLGVKVCAEGEISSNITNGDRL